MSPQENSTYPQALPMTFDEMEQFLDLPLIAKLGSHNKDGTIHIAPIWFRYHKGEILLGTQEITQKVQNIKSDPRVTVMVDTTEPRLKGVIIYGKAELEYDDVILKRTSIFEKYMSSERAPEKAKGMASKWKPVVVRIKPDKIISFDYSKGFGIGSSSDAQEIQI